LLRIPPRLNIEITLSFFTEVHHKIRYRNLALGMLVNEMPKLFSVLISVSYMNQMIETKESWKNYWRIVVNRMIMVMMTMRGLDKGKSYPKESYSNGHPGRKETNFLWNIWPV